MEVKILLQGSIEAQNPHKTVPRRYVQPRSDSIEEYSELLVP